MLAKSNTKVLLEKNFFASLIFKQKWHFKKFLLNSISSTQLSKEYVAKLLMEKVMQSLIKIRVVVHNYGRTCGDHCPSLTDPSVLFIDSRGVAARSTIRAASFVTAHFLHIGFHLMLGQNIV